MNDISELFSPPSTQALLGLIFQVAILGYLLIWLWRRIVGSQAERLVKGVLVLAAIWGLAWVFKLTLITSLLNTIVPVAVIGLVVVFQPELRRGLGHLGRVEAFKLDLSLSGTADKARVERDVEQIISAARELSRSKTGALIVIEPAHAARDYLSPGTTVNADITSTLLLTIFFANSPLHDGAVIVRQGKIVAAGVILPMTEDAHLSYKFGTRHRAALGLSALYDGLCIVVSEETGEISAASRGMLMKYKTADELKKPIMYLFTQGEENRAPSTVSNFLSLFGFRRAESEPKSAPEIKTAVDVSAETKESATLPRVGSSRSRTGMMMVPKLESKDKEKEGDFISVSDSSDLSSFRTGESENVAKNAPAELSSEN